MNLTSLSVAGLVLCLVSPGALEADLPVESAGQAGASTAPVLELDSDPLTPEARQAVEQLLEELPADSEARAMLDAILEGSQLGMNEGWFRMAITQTRFGWDHVAATYDANQDQMVTEDEFPGNSAEFARLDRNGDQRLTAEDFDWSMSSTARTPGSMVFFRADRDANGKVTRDEFLQWFDVLDTDGQGFLALDDLREQFPNPSAAAPSAGDRRPDDPTRSTLIFGLRDQELGSLQPGPDLDEVAPDFTLQTIEGESVTLSEQIGERPVVLIFGNLTCGPFRSQAGNLEKLFQRYRDQVHFFLVYVREAHPTDGWWMLSNQRAGIEITQPREFADRLQVAATCRAHLDLDLPFLVDTLDDAVGSRYSGMPNRLYLIDRQGRIAFKNGRGPFGFHPRELEQALILLLHAED